MSNELWERAEKLAARPYDVQVLGEETPDGQTIYLARNPELYGCKAQGETIEEAIANLNEARIDYIYALLEDHLPVPEPANQATKTGSPEDKTRTLRYTVETSPSQENRAEHIDEAEEQLFEASFKT